MSAITPHLIFITPFTHTHPPIQRMERESYEMFLFENSTHNNIQTALMVFSLRGPFEGVLVFVCVRVCVCVCVCYLERESNTASGPFLDTGGDEMQSKERERKGVKGGGGGKKTG